MSRSEEPLLLDFLKKQNPLSRFNAASERTFDRDAHAARAHHGKDSLKVLSWNINKQNKSELWQKEFRQLLAQYQPDKIFLQEVCLCAYLAHTPRSKSVYGLSHIEPTLSWSFAPNFLDTVTNTYSGVLTATKNRLVSSQSLTSDHTEPILQTPKATLFAEYSLSEYSDNLLTVNTHLINFVSLSKFEAQLSAIEQVLEKHTGTIILSGDFNTWNSARWQMLRDMTARLELSSVSFGAQDISKIKSFLRSPPLDHIFYRGFEQKQLSAKVVDEVTSSDHNPLIVELNRV